MPVPHIAGDQPRMRQPRRPRSILGYLVGGEAAVETPGFCEVKVGDIYLGAALVANYQPPTWPSRAGSQQIHLDLAVDDLDTAEQRAIGLGATKESHRPNGGQPRVLGDPAGHPLCLRHI